MKAGQPAGKTNRKISGIPQASLASVTSVTQRHKFYSPSTYKVCMWLECLNFDPVEKEMGVKAGS